MTQYSVDWLLDCEPRRVQLEALTRSYQGIAMRDRFDDESAPEPLHHYGAPALGWGHMLEMRLGKTPTLLNEFMLTRRDFGIRRLVVFSPNKYRDSWAAEAHKFGIDVPVYVFVSNKKNEIRKLANPNREFALIVHYEALQQRDACDILDEIIDSTTFLAADESVVIKNKDSNTTKRALHLSKDAAFTRALTGKPTPQGVHDLYTQLRFIRKIEGMNFFQFRNTFALMGGFKGKQVLGVKNAERLHGLTRQCYFFARRLEWGTNFEPDYEVVDVGMSRAQKDAYQQMEAEFVAALEDGTLATADQVVSKYIKLQQISSGFVIDEEGVARSVLEFDKTPKAIELRDRLLNYIRHKSLVIAHYNETIDRLVELLADFRPAVIRGDARMRRAGLNVEDEKHRFNTDPDCRVLIGQTTAIKYGHNLMGPDEAPCLSTVYFENNYSLDDRSQSEQRNQGEGQQGAIHIQDFVSSGAEKRAVRALQKKEDVAAAIMGYYQERKSG